MSFDYPLNESLVDGLSNLKTGALFSLIAYALSFVVMLIAMSMMPGLMTPGMAGPRVFPVRSMTALLGVLTLIVVAGIAVLVLAILAFYKFYKAAGHLKEYDPSKLGIGRTGILISLAGLGVIIIGVLILIASLAGAGASVGPQALGGVLRAIFALVGLIIIAAVLVIIGSILFGIMIMRLAEVEGLDPGFKLAGILYIAGVILGLIPNLGVVGTILGVVATILIYTYSKNGLEALKSNVMGEGGD
ncbi:MAG: DUF973 family protein [Candidatus Korarchaeota archaeon]|nr:DUF973 family protein [Candidatus Korarchaeota archaeon]